MALHSNFISHIITQSIYRYSIHLPALQLYQFIHPSTHPSINLCLFYISYCLPYLLSYLYVHYDRPIYLPTSPLTDMPRLSTCLKITCLTYEHDDRPALFVDPSLVEGARLLQLRQIFLARSVKPLIDNVSFCYSFYRCLVL